MRIDAASYVGLPWRERGRDRGGLDCFGLARLVLREVFKVDLPAFTEVSPADVEDVARMVAREKSASAWRLVSLDDQREGDVALFRQELALPTHVGVVLRPWRMLHVQRGGLSMVAPFDDASWAGRLWRWRLVSIYRYAGMV